MKDSNRMTATDLYGCMAVLTGLLHAYWWMSLFIFITMACVWVNIHHRAEEEMRAHDLPEG